MITIFRLWSLQLGVILSSLLRETGPSECGSFLPDIIRKQFLGTTIGSEKLVKNLHIVHLSPPGVFGCTAEVQRFRRLGGDVALPIQKKTLTKIE